MVPDRLFRSHLVSRLPLPVSHLHFHFHTILFHCPLPNTNIVTNRAACIYIFWMYSSELCCLKKKKKQKSFKICTIKSIVFIILLYLSLCDLNSSYCSSLSAKATVKFMYPCLSCYSIHTKGNT